MRYNNDYFELEQNLLKRVESEEKMSLRKFLAIFELSALASMK